MIKAERQLEIYVRAIAKLDAAKDAGEIDLVRWEVLRAQIMAEATKPKRPGDVNLLITLGCIGGLAAIGIGIFQFLVTVL